MTKDNLICASLETLLQQYIEDKPDHKRTLLVLSEDVWKRLCYETGWSADQDPADRYFNDIPIRVFDHFPHGSAFYIEYDKFIMYGPYGVPK